MKLRITLLTIVISLFAGNSFAQEEESFIPYGKPILRIYTNFHGTFTGNESGKAFEIQRAYFGFQYQFSKNISGKLILDVGDPQSR